MKQLDAKQVIFRNSVFLFVRSIIVILLGFYAARVLLEKLGIEDFGVYNIVSGVVLMFHSLRIFFSSAIQRFLNYTKGLGDEKQQNKIFNTGVQIQLVLAGLFFVLMETVGLVVFMHLNLTPEQFSVAKVLFQLAIVTAIVSMMTVPYDALLIANERMDVYALFSIMDYALRLVIIFLISIGPFEQLINYSVLLLVVTILMLTVTALYCHRHFVESKFHWLWDKSLIKDMGRFAGWNFLGNTGNQLTHEGVNFILNLAGGVTVNAARTIAYQMMGGVSTLVTNVNTAYKPQINASAAYDEKRTFYKLLGYNAKVTFIFYLLIVVPLLIFARPIVQFWLGHVPEHVIPFLLAISIYHLLRSLHELVNQFFISIGEMKEYQIIEISVMILILPLAYFLLKQGLPFWTVFIGMSVLEVVNHSATVWVATRKFKFPFMYFVKEVYTPFLMMTLISVLIFCGAYYLKWSEVDGPLNGLLHVMATEGLLLLVTSAFFLKKEERKDMVRIIFPWRRKKD